eukprot:GFYU01003877.1.p1 GENE.GFYU01003877.1~~GFYU01003877.1.p1  ORF type:complete len:533 (+),score=108.90 GFYU01003877.1:169-1767(+)
MPPTVDAAALNAFRFSRKNSPEGKRKDIEKELMNFLIYWTIKRAMKEEIIKPQYKAEDIERMVREIMKASGLDTKLRNAVYLLTKAGNNAPDLEELGQTYPALPPIPQEEESLENVRALKEKWVKRTRDELVRVSNEFKIPFARPAPEDDEDDEVPNLRFVYDHNQFLEAISQLKNTNYSGHYTRIIGWGMISVELKTSDMNGLREKFADLCPDNRQMGVDDYDRDGRRGWFYQERMKFGDKVLRNGYIPIARQYARVGLPNDLRREIWTVILDCTCDEKDQAYYDALERDATKWELLTDDLIRLDCHLFTSNEDAFPFEEMLEQLYMALTRDTWLVDNCSSSAGPPLSAMSRTSRNLGAYPPCGIVPYAGFVSFALPLLFLHTDYGKAYFMLRQLYANYFCKLNVISSKPEHIIHLCKLFEDLVQTNEPEVFFHMVQLGVPPLKVAFPWIFYGFCGYLPVDQVMQVWDRLLGFDTLEIFPVLSAAIFSFRAKTVLRATDAEEVWDIFSDLSNLMAIPLLQFFLFSNNQSRV